jgi:capsular exopolysaccharide synthesis family protein
MGEAIVHQGDAPALAEAALVLHDEDDGGLDLTRHARVLRQNAGLIAGLVVIVTLGAVLSAVRSPRLYRAEAMLLVAPRDPRVVDIQGIASEAVEDETRYLRTQYQVLKSRALAEQVIRDNGLRQEPLLGGVKSGPSTDWSRLDPSLIDTYLAGVDVEAVPGTRLIKVTYAAKDAVLAARLANAHVDAFVRQGLRQRTAVNQAGLEFLHARLAELKDRLQVSEAALAEYRWQKGILVTDEKKENVVVEQLDEINKELSKAEADRLTAEAELRTVEQQGVKALPDLVKNAAFHELEVQFAMADAEWARMASQFKPNYPGVAELKRKTDTIREHLDAEIARVGDSVRSAYRAAKEKEERLRTRFDEQKQHALEQKDAAVEYSILAREVDTNRALYESVLQRMKEMTVAVEARASNVSVADRAVVPGAPSGPGPLRAIGFAALLAMLAGVVIAFVRDALDDSVQTADDVERATRLPNLGVVPEMADGTVRPATGGRWPRLLGARPADEPTIVVAGQPYSALTDAYRHVRTSLLLSKPGGPPRTLLVASGLDGEGKTVTATNLAVAFSHLGNVLLVDADLRRPGCHRFFDVPVGPGLAEVLTGRCALDDALRPIEGKRLVVLSGGATPPNPTELLGSEEMRCLLTEAGMRFDYVVVDSPAAFGVADASVLSTLVDAVVVVARGGRTRRRFLRKLRARLAYVHAPVVGVVLNGGDDTNEPTSHYYRTIEVARTVRPTDARGQRAA